MNEKEIISYEDLWNNLKRVMEIMSEEKGESQHIYRQIGSIMRINDGTSEIYTSKELCGYFKEAE